MNKRLTRSSTNKVLGGVCAGIARQINWDPSIFRLIFVLVSFFSAAFPGILAYIVLWIIMPEDRDVRY